MDKRDKPILCLDFDGVCNRYDHGWQGAAVISDDAVAGLFEFLVEAAEHFDLQIYSSRSHHPGGIEAMRAWFAAQHGRWQAATGRSEALPALGFPLVKPPAWVTLDDRALTFEGVFPEVEALRKFQPWNKRKAGG